MNDERPEVDHRSLAITANGETWEFLGHDELSADQLDELIERAYASAYHWRQVTEAGAIQRARAAWMLSRCHTLAGHGDLALHHAERCRELTAAATGRGEAQDFDLAYVHEAKARALALLGRLDEATAERTLAGEISISDDQDRSIFDGDLQAGPWFGLEDS